MLRLKTVFLYVFLTGLSFGQDLNLDQFFNSQFEPTELNIDSESRIDSLYNDYLDYRRGGGRANYSLVVNNEDTYIYDTYLELQTTIKTHTMN